MKKQSLLLMSAVLFSLSMHVAGVNAASSDIAADPLSTERNPGPPALTPAETRAKQEQERMLNRANRNGTQVVPIGSDNGAGKNFPGTLPGTNPGLNNGDSTNQPQPANGSNGANENSTTPPSTSTPSAPLAPSTPAPPPTGNPGVQ